MLLLQLAAIRQFEAMQARKDQDIQEEWLMRQKEKSKNVVDLPNGGIVSLLIKSGEPEVKTLGEEIDELEVGVKSKHKPLALLTHPLSPHIS